MNTTPKFVESFDSFACILDSLTVNLGGIDYTATIHFDGDYNIDDDDCHNEDQTVTGCDDEQFEKLLAARQAWFDDEWCYIFIVVEAMKGGIDLDVHASLSGIEMNYPGSDNAYLTETANELLAQAFDMAPDAVEYLIDSLQE